MGQDLKNGWIILCQLITLGAGQAKIEASRPLAPACTRTPLQGPGRNFPLMHGCAQLAKSALPAFLCHPTVGGSRRERMKLRFAGLHLLQNLRSQHLLTLKEFRSRSRAKADLHYLHLLLVLLECHLCAGTGMHTLTDRHTYREQ